MMSLWDALRMNMMISYQELVRTFPSNHGLSTSVIDLLNEMKSLIYFIVNESKSFCAMYVFVFLHV
ncbi:Uncharacterised protein [Klebsiella pneumoniae]|nr:hypothetical protein D4N10_28795 [Klebsiella pneumoniae]SVN09451.1 Uncharacterised protein [Klebsiella pneumoniae]